jgi:hypothetical protein
VITFLEEQEKTIKITVPVAQIHGLNDKSDEVVNKYCLDFSICTRPSYKMHIWEYCSRIIFEYGYTSVVLKLSVHMHAHTLSLSLLLSLPP